MDAWTRVDGVANDGEAVDSFAPWFGGGAGGTDPTNPSLPDTGGTVEVGDGWGEDAEEWLADEEDAKVVAEAWGADIEYRLRR